MHSIGNIPQVAASETGTAQTDCSTGGAYRSQASKCIRKPGFYPMLSNRGYKAEILFIQEKLQNHMLTEVAGKRRHRR